MELLYFFSVFARNLKAIVVTSVLIALCAASAAIWVIPMTYKTTITFSTTMRVDQGVTAEKYDPLSYIEASDRFAETMLGWFRNPIIFEEIQEKVENNTGVDLQKVMKVRKQEKQNLNIIFTTPTQEQAQLFREATMTYLKDRVANINDISNTRLELVNESAKIEGERQSPVLLGLIGFLGSLFLLGIFFFIYEAARGKVSFLDQVEEALGVSVFHTIRKTGDAAYIAEAIARIPGTTVVLDTKTRNVDLITEVLFYLSHTLNKKSLLIDGLPGRQILTEKLGLSDLMSRVKGFFDTVSKNEVQALPMLLNKQEPNTYYWGAGKGNIPNLESLPVLRDHYEYTVLYTNLDDGIFTYALPEVHFVVLVELGKTTLADLRILRSFVGDRITVFAVK